MSVWQQGERPVCSPGEAIAGRRHLAREVTSSEQIQGIFFLREGSDVVQLEKEIDMAWFRSLAALGVKLANRDCAGKAIIESATLQLTICYICYTECRVRSIRSRIQHESQEMPRCVSPAVERDSDSEGVARRKLAGESNPFSSKPLLVHWPVSPTSSP